MTDRELLELAAKAAGVEYDAERSNPHPVSGAWWGLWLSYDRERGQFDRCYWNPLTDDGDALRLAVRLGLALNLSPREDCRGQTVVAYHGFCKIEQSCLNGREDAARRAIVLAAAEIGRGLSEGNST